MRKLHPTAAFTRDWKKVSRPGTCSAEKLRQITELLLGDLPLLARLHDHALSGQWAGMRDCHVAFDLLLIYAKSPEEVRLLRLASHSEVFG